MKQARQRRHQVVVVRSILAVRNSLHWTKRVATGRSRPRRDIEDTGNVLNTTTQTALTLALMLCAKLDARFGVAGYSIVS